MAFGSEEFLTRTWTAPQTSCLVTFALPPVSCRRPVIGEVTSRGWKTTVSGKPRSTSARSLKAWREAARCSEDWARSQQPIRAADADLFFRLSSGFCYFFYFWNRLFFIYRFYNKNFSQICKIQISFLTRSDVIGSAGGTVFHSGTSFLEFFGASDFRLHVCWWTETVTSDTSCATFPPQRWGCFLTCTQKHLEAVLVRIILLHKRFVCDICTCCKYACLIWSWGWWWWWWSWPCSTRSGGDC